MLLIAEQMGGSQYHATIDYLKKNYYYIEKLTLDKKLNNIWADWKNDKESILKKRACEIANKFKRFIKEKIN